MNDGSLQRIALLARPGPACERLHTALQEIPGGELVLEADPTQIGVDELKAAAPQAVVVVLDSVVEDVINGFDAVLADPATDVLYEEADLAVAREGWDVARWGRHVSAKLLQHDDVLPPGREPDDKPPPDASVQPAPVAGEAAPDETAGAGNDSEASPAAGSGASPFDPVAAEFATEPVVDDTVEVDGGNVVAEAAVDIDAHGIEDGPVINDGRDNPSGSAPDLGEIERRISGLSLVNTPEHATPAAPDWVTRAVATSQAAATAATAPAETVPEQQGGHARGAVLILAGIGGPDAVRQLLGALPADFPRPVLVQQRLDGGRHDRLVQQMGKITKLPVALAESDGAAEVGHVYILPPEIGISAGDGGLRFTADDQGLVAALPADDSAVLLFSGSDADHVDAVMVQAGNGAFVAGQLPENCYDSAAAAMLVERGGQAGEPAELARRLVEHWAA